MIRESGQTTSPLDDALTAEDVAAFLRDHPDFLVHHPELIPHLVPPAVDRGQGVIDMQAFLLERLRGEVGRLSDQQRELIATTRANINNQNRVHAAALFLLDSGSLAQLIQAIGTDLAVLLDLDVAALAVESVPETVTPIDRARLRLLESGGVARLLGRRHVLLRSDIQGGTDLYGLETVRSDALVRLTLQPEAPPALLALGSREPDMFHPGQATELLQFLAHVVERCLRCWLVARDGPPP
ncbi:DUF484 family protein [Oleisolibacter albus]|uniref:DUF484 family protein n=1 Tax=Oleisolibacter albus TaxID=2171757 RepID=UPI000DF2C666|nr:DUF484 family protein [Oleisolibacter albus]